MGKILLDAKEYDELMTCLERMGDELHDMRSMSTVLHMLHSSVEDEGIKVSRKAKSALLEHLALAKDTLDRSGNALVDLVQACFWTLNLRRAHGEQKQ